ncbi:hypothetical protein SAMN04488115_109149 [Bosea lathyri]|uniref:Uncharacterized protein n=1 Tax=Bosea lathyri TaxID=1036778 RepID=A0A1H6C955_9HYPH|nr:hypothetical protein SAMN04488115_109149 [Bosea lathyri]
MRAAINEIGSEASRKSTSFVATITRSRPGRSDCDSPSTHQEPTRQRGADLRHHLHAGAIDLDGSRTPGASLLFSGRSRRLRCIRGLVNRPINVLFLGPDCECSEDEFRLRRHNDHSRAEWPQARAPRSRIMLFPAILPRPERFVRLAYRSQCRIWLRKSFVRSCCGFLKNSLGSFTSTTLPGIHEDDAVGDLTGKAHLVGGGNFKPLLRPLAPTCFSRGQSPPHNRWSRPTQSRMQSYCRGCVSTFGGLLRCRGRKFLQKT